MKVSIAIFVKVLLILGAFLTVEAKRRDGSES